MESAASRTVRISFEASFEACFARNEAVGVWGGLLLPPGRGTILIASWKRNWSGVSGEKSACARDKDQKDHLFARLVVGRELDLAHAACAEGLCHGVIADDAARGAA